MKAENMRYVSFHRWKDPWLLGKVEGRRLSRWVENPSRRFKREVADVKYLYKKQKAKRDEVIEKVFLLIFICVCVCFTESCEAL
jgi:hypothetical protein